MADNITSPATAGTILATDEISNVHHQKVKLEFGDADSAIAVSNTNPLPVLGSISTTYTAADPTRTEGQVGPLRSDVAGALLVNPVTAGAGDDFNHEVVGIIRKPGNGPAYAPLYYRTKATPLKADVVKISGGAFQSVVIHNFDTTKGAWFQFHNINAVPTTTASQTGPSLYIPAATSSTNPGKLTIPAEIIGGVVDTSLGVAWAICTTENGFTLTDIAATDLHEYIAYV